MTSEATDATTPGEQVAEQVEQVEPATHSVYTVVEAAAILRVHPETVRRAIRAGHLLAWSPPGEGRARHLRISRPDLLAYWKAGGGDDLPIQRVK
jgi:excisionase family DNA binding protein